MGYDSVLKIKAKKVKVDIYGHGIKEEVVGLFLQIADSNLWRTNKKGREVMSRSWKMFKPDMEWRLMQSVVEFSSSCESGMLKYKGRDIGAETLIRACRKAIQNAPIVENFSCGGSDYPSFARIEMALCEESLADMDKWDKDKLEELEKLQEPSKSYDCKVFEWASNEEGLKEFLKYSSIFKSKVCWHSTEYPW